MTPAFPGIKLARLHRCEEVRDGVELPGKYPDLERPLLHRHQADDRPAALRDDLLALQGRLDQPGKMDFRRMDGDLSHDGLPEPAQDDRPHQLVNLTSWWFACVRDRRNPP